MFHLEPTPLSLNKKKKKKKILIFDSRKQGVKVYKKLDKNIKNMDSNFNQKLVSSQFRIPKQKNKFRFDKIIGLWGRVHSKFDHKLTYEFSKNIYCFTYPL